MVVTPRLRAVLFTLIACSFCIAFARAAEPASPGWRLTLPAADVDRLAQVIRIELPQRDVPEVWSGEDGGGTYDLQRLNDGTGIVFVPEQKAHQTLVLRPYRGTYFSGQSVKVRVKPHGLFVTFGSLEILGYATDPRLPEGVDPVFARGAFIHPVRTPRRVQVTDAFPADHYHQNGIWTAWTDTTFRGESLDFWNLRKREGTVEFSSLDDTFDGPAAGGFASTHRAVDLRGGTRATVLEEKWRVTAYPVFDVNACVFDLDVTQTNVSDAPLELNAYRYGGLGVRGSAQWLGAENAFFLTSEGETDRVRAHATRMRWCHIGGYVDGAFAGAAVLGHPDNFRAPQPARVSPTEPFFCFAPVQLGEFVIGSREQHRMRYRFVVEDGPPDRKRLDAFWNGYARPAVARLEWIE